MNRLKEYLIGALGSIGSALYLVVCLFSVVLPLAMIEMPLWLSIIVSGTVLFFPALAHIFIIWGFISALTGPQDLFAIIYYVFFACICLVSYIPAVFHIVSGLISFLGSLISENGKAWKTIKFIFAFMAWVLVAFWATDGFSKFPALFEQKNKFQTESTSVENEPIYKQETELETEPETDNVYEIILNAQLNYNEGIGNNWDVVFRYKGREIESGERISFRETPGPTYNFATKENDNRPYQKVYVSVHITEKEGKPDSNTMLLSLSPSTSEEGIVVVTENDGYNKGKKAEWSVSGQLRLVEKATNSPTESK